MKQRLFTYLFCLNTVFAFGQNKSALVSEGNYYFEVKDYFSAIYFYELTLEKDSTLSSLWHPLAESYQHTHQYSKAIQYFQKADALNQDAKYPNILLYLGMLHKNIGSYDEASTYLQTFLDEHPYPSDYWYRKGLMELKGSELARFMKDNDEVKVEHLDDKVNSSVSDFAPFTDEQERLYFSTMDKDDGLANELYIGHRSTLMVADKGGVAKPFNAFNDFDYHIANLTLNPDGTEAFFTKCKNEKNDIQCYIYKSILKDGLWQTPQLMDERFNTTNAKNTHPQWALWEGVEGLFISSDRRGGEGDLDIWFVPMQGSPQHLGNGINTVGKEVTPFYHSTERVLYFSSDFHPGLGGFDIFQTPWEENWGLVSNVGKPLNSSANDLYYSSRLDSPLLGYFSSNRSGSQTLTYESCCNDIYAFEKTEECVCVKIDSLATAMRLNLPLSLYFHNDEPNPNTRDSTTTLSYTDAYDSFVSLKEEYVKRFASVLGGRAKNQAERQMRVFFDQTVNQGMMQLNTFAQQLEAAMALGASVDLRLKGFTSPLTDSDYNNLLAKRRISSVENYLRSYNEGVLLPYLDSGALSLVELPLGETQVNMEVSDNPNDRRNSVYSIKASRERRIEIQSISVEF